MIRRSSDIGHQSCDFTAIAKFNAELEKVGYPESLIRGTDPILNERVRKMLQSIDNAAVAKEAGL